MRKICKNSNEWTSYRKIAIINVQNILKKQTINVETAEITITNYSKKKRQQRSHFISFDKLQ